MGKKGYLEISFTWVFAIIIGVVILFLAIYFSSRVIDIGQTEIDAETGKEIGILLNPLETGFESGKTNLLTMPVETRIYNKCDTFGNFGMQIISVSQKSFNEWTNTNVETSFKNKYLFSDDYVEGKKFHLFSKPFNFPFKVADLIYITSSEDNYCFIDAPDRIENEISFLGQKNLFLDNCSGNEIKVCFESSNCEINVRENYVEKNEDRIYFSDDSLMYAAIFSDKELYECQLKRLMERVSELALLYNDKANFVSRVDCNSNLNLIGLSNSAESFDSSNDIIYLSKIAEELEEKNDVAECRLW